MAVVFILILGSIGGYIYLQRTGFSLAGSSVHTVKKTTTAQKKEYLKGVKKEIPAIRTITASVDELIKGVRNGTYKSQFDINKKAADIENRMESAMGNLKRLKVPEEFGSAQKELLSTFSTYKKTVDKLRRINNVIAGNMDQIENSLLEIDNLYRQGTQQFNTALGLLRKKQGELKLGSIL
jgi:methyl-accepting chemotaxis protein